MAVPHDNFQQHLAEMPLLCRPLSSVPLPQADFLEITNCDLIFDATMLITARHSHAAQLSLNQAAQLPRSEILFFATLSSSKADSLLLFSSSRLRCVSLKSLSTSGDVFPSPSKFPLFALCCADGFSAWLGCCCCCTRTCYSLICTTLVQQHEQQEGMNSQVSVLLLYSSHETSVTEQHPVFVACVWVCHRAWTICWRSCS